VTPGTFGSTWSRLGVAKYLDATGTFPRARADDHPRITATSPGLEGLPDGEEVEPGRPPPDGAGVVAAGPAADGPVEGEVEAGVGVDAEVGLLVEAGLLEAPPHPAVAAANARTPADLQHPGRTGP
jgi:hypothetical protein